MFRTSRRIHGEVLTKNAVMLVLNFCNLAFGFISPNFIRWATLDIKISNRGGCNYFSQIDKNIVGIAALNDFVKRGEINHENKRNLKWCATNVNHRAWRERERSAGTCRHRLSAKRLRRSGRLRCVCSNP